MRSMARAACERTGLTRKSLSVGSLVRRGIVTWSCCADAGEAGAVMEGVGADGRVPTFEACGTVPANAHQALHTRRQSSGRDTGRERLAWIFRIKAKAVKCCRL